VRGRCAGNRFAASTPPRDLLKCGHGLLSRRTGGRSPCPGTASLRGRASLVGQHYIIQSSGARAGFREPLRCHTPASRSFEVSAFESSVAQGCRSPGRGPLPQPGIAQLGSTGYFKALVRVRASGTRCAAEYPHCDHSMQGFGNSVGKGRRSPDWGPLPQPGIAQFTGTW